MEVPPFGVHNAGSGFGGDGNLHIQEIIIVAQLIVTGPVLGLFIEV